MQHSGIILLLVLLFKRLFDQRFILSRQEFLLLHRASALVCMAMQIDDHEAGGIQMVLSLCFSDPIPFVCSLCY